MGIGGRPPLHWMVSAYNNIAQTTWATQGNIARHSNLYAASNGGNYGTYVTWGGAGIENVFKGKATFCAYGVVCDPGFNQIGDTGTILGTNLYINPAFKNTAHLLSNHMGVPSCSGFATTTACMGWNGSSVTALSVIDDLTPTATGTAGKGYQIEKLAHQMPIIRHG